MRFMVAASLFLVVGGCSGQDLKNDAIEESEITQWVSDCRASDIEHSSNAKDTPKSERAILPLERRLLSFNANLSNERKELEANLSKEENIVQSLSFVTFFISMLAACFVAVNANHFQTQQVNNNGNGRAPRWFILMVILLPIISASLNGYIALVSPKNEAERTRQRLFNISGIHKQMAISLANVNCITAADPDVSNFTRLSQSIEVRVLQYGASLQEQLGPGAGNAPPLNSGAPPPPPKQ